MVMEVSRHEEILNTLNNPDLEHTERTQLLSELRSDFTTVVTDFSTNTKTITELEKERNDLLLAHSQMFRQLGTKEEDDLSGLLTEPKKLKDLFK